MTKQPDTFPVGYVTKKGEMLKLTIVVNEDLKMEPKGEIHYAYAYVYIEQLMKILSKEKELTAMFQPIID